VINLLLFILGEEAIVNKTFHSYTVRAKQGGSQSTQDRSKGGCKSAGASLRRYNEASQLKVQYLKLNYLKVILSNKFLFSIFKKYYHHGYTI